MAMKNMAASNKMSKEMIVVTFKEIPEYITVETRHISRAAAQQNNYDNVNYVHFNQGQIELTPYDTMLAHNQVQNLRSVRPVLRSIKNTIISGPKTLTLTPLMQNTQIPTSFASASTSGSPFSFKTLPNHMNAAPYHPTSIANFSAGKSNTLMPISTVTLPFPNPMPPPPHFGPTTSLMRPSIETKDVACLTDPKPINIDQQQQFSWKPNVESIAIQCCIEDEMFDDLDIEADQNISAPTDTVEVIAEKKQEFLEYVRQNSIEHKNNMRECLICGEVCKSSKYFYGHMAVHRGPESLCFRCGKCLEHDSMLKTHFCIGTERENRALLRCPHRRCTVVAVSRLELYDHLNEHIGFRMHNCSTCRVSFCTAQEFLRHLLLAAKCFIGAKRHRYRFYGLHAVKDLRWRARVFALHSHTKRTVMAKMQLSKRLKCKHLCELCFRSFRSKYIYHRHAKKCASLLKKRTSRKTRPKASNHLPI